MRELKSVKRWIQATVNKGEQLNEAFRQPVCAGAALAAIGDLERFRANLLSRTPVAGFTVVSARLTPETASVPDGLGNVLTVSPAAR